jgi:hypothetical protein
MSVNEHIDQEELTLYALRFLSDKAAAEIEQHLVECTGCGDAVALIRGDLATFAMTADVHSPPSSARQRLMTQVARERKVLPIDRAAFEDTASPLSNRLLIEDPGLPQRSVGAKVLPWVNWVGWAVAACLTVTVVDLYRDRDDLRTDVARQASQMASLTVDAEKGRALVSALTDKSALRVTLTGAPVKAVPQGRAAYQPEKGALIFTASNLQPLQPFKTYELWVIPVDGHDPIPAGTFRPDDRGNASIIMPDIPKGIIAKAFGVTIEDEGGSLQPTLPIVLSGA